MKQTDVDLGPQQASAECPSGSSAGSPAAPGPNGGQAPPSGLDRDRHLAGQKTARDAEGIRKGFLPACMATALSASGLLDVHAFRTYLDQFLQECGEPRDPVERVLLEQLAFAHLRLAALHSECAEAKHVDAVKILNAAAARMLGELRRLALAIQEYRHRTPISDGVRLAKIG